MMAAGWKLPQGGWVAPILVRLQLHPQRCLDSLPVFNISQGAGGAAIFAEQDFVSNVYTD
jgi:hypothetical protein